MARTQRRNWGQGCSQAGSSEILELDIKQQTKQKGLGGWEACRDMAGMGREAQGNYLMLVFPNHHVVLL